MLKNPNSSVVRPRALAFAISLLSLFSVAALTLPERADAQRAVRRPTGEVTGVEISLEGALHAHRGRSLRWMITTYDVHGLDRLEVAPNAQILVSTSLEGLDPIDVRSDERGRAMVEIPIPTSAGANVGVAIVVRTASQVMRRFEVGAAISDPLSLHVTPLTPSLAPDERPQAIIALRDVVTHAPLRGAPIEVTLMRGSTPVGESVEVTTDATGVALATLPAPDEDPRGRLQIRAVYRDPDHRSRVHRATARLHRRSETPSPLRVAVAPSGSSWAPRTRSRSGSAYAGPTAAPSRARR